MDSPAYTIGLDFGTLSVRGVLARVPDGYEECTAVREYHVYESVLPCGKTVKSKGALADPAEYISAMTECIRDLLHMSRMPAQAVKAVAIDANSMSMVAADVNGVPLCFSDRWKTEPSAYIKLWKSYSAGDETARIMQCALAQNEPLLSACGLHPSTEGIYPKMLETLHDAPALYRETAYFIDLGDWLTWQLCGEATRSVNSLSMKAYWLAGRDLPPDSFWESVETGFGGANEKLKGRRILWGEKAGGITAEAAAKTGLLKGTAVACAGLDGHTSMLAMGIDRSGDAMMTVGTSGVLAAVSDRWRVVPGVCGQGKDGLVPGFFGYDSCQSSVGDTFAWYIRECLPGRFEKQADEEKVSLHSLLNRLSFAHPPDPEGPVALDWWNGNRSILCDQSLRGMITGLTLSTRPEQFYRSLVESTAFGMRKILENYERHGIAVGRIFACGGIAAKSPEIMQCYADVLGRELNVSGVPNAAALGSAIGAAAAAGALSGGYDSLREAALRMSVRSFKRFTPNPINMPAYETLYRKYSRLHDSFAVRS